MAKLKVMFGWVVNIAKVHTAPALEAGFEQAALPYYDDAVGKKGVFSLIGKTVCSYHPAMAVDLKDALSTYNWSVFENEVAAKVDAIDARAGIKKQLAAEKPTVYMFLEE